MRLYFLVVFLFAALLLLSCAKVKEPYPPPILIPRPASDLSGMQVGNRIILNCSIPKLNTNGSPVSTLKMLKVYRATEPRGADVPPITEQLFARRADLIKTISIEELKNYSSNGKFVFYDQLEPAKNLEESFRYAVKLVNNKNQDAGFSNFFSVSPACLPDPPRDIKISYTQDAIEIAWGRPEMAACSHPPKIIGYKVFRSEAGSGAQKLVNEKPTAEQRIKDSDFEFGKTYHYSVDVVVEASHTAESLKSSPVAVTPIDTFPPTPPAQVTAFSEGGRINLAWRPSPESDVSGYNVYRSETSGKDYIKLTPSPVAQPSYTDAKVVAGKTYYYVVSAIDKSGNESTYSNEVGESP